MDYFSLLVKEWYKKKIFLMPKFRTMKKNTTISNSSIDDPEVLFYLMDVYLENWH